MVFVWSYLTDGDPAYTLVQVSINDLIMLVAFAPIVTVSRLRGRVASRCLFACLLHQPWPSSWSSRWLLGSLSRHRSDPRTRPGVVEHAASCRRFRQSRCVALLATLVLIFAFQAENITTQLACTWLLIAVPILIQVYFNSSLVYGLMRLFKVRYEVAAPGALIGASNFFELAVADGDRALWAELGAALATVVGVLVEVPVMLSVCRMCISTRRWFDPAYVTQEESS